MVTAARPGEVTELTADEGRAFLDERVQSELQVGLDEFIRLWRNGYYGEPDEHPVALELAMLLPIVGVNPWSNGVRA